GRSPGIRLGQAAPGRLDMLICVFQAQAGIRDFHVTGVQTCALPISAGVVVVLVVFPVVRVGSAVFMHQGVGGVLEGVVLHGHGGGFDPFFVGELEHAGLLGAATGFGVAGDRIQFRGVAVVVGKNQCWLFFTIHAAVLVAV